MSKYARSIRRLHKAVLREAGEATPSSAGEIRIFYTPESFIEAGRKVMNSSSNKRTVESADQDQKKK